MIVDLLLGLVSLVLLLGSAFFSGSETALFALSAQQRHELEARKDRRARRVCVLLADLRSVLVTVLIGNTFVNIFLAVLMTRIFIRHLGPERGPLIGGFAVTGLLLVFGEILPKSLAVRSPRRHSLRVGRALLRVKALLAWPTAGLRRLNRFILEVMDRLLPGDDLEMQEDEMRALLSLGEEAGSFGARERRLVEGAFELGDVRVQDVMTPRVDLYMLDAETPAAEAAVSMRRAGRSFAPVYRQTPDRVLGLLSASALLRAEAQRPVGEICDVVEFCPESHRAGSLLLELLERDAPLAVALDEYGALAGLVTLADLFAVLAGEFQSGADTESLRYAMPDPNTLVASSRLPVARAEELLGARFAVESAETLGGYLMEQLGEVPEPGRPYRFDDFEWLVLTARGPALGTLRLERRS